MDLNRWGPYEILQLLLVLMFGLPAVYLLVTSGTVPKELWGIEGVIVGFFFAGAARSQAEKQMARMLRL